MPLQSVEISPEEWERALKTGGSARKEYIRPDEADVEAQAAWLITKAPASKPRVVELLSGWYGNACALCETDVDLDLAGTHPGRWNIDHIIPKSAGGGWTFGNLRLVHRACNMERSNEVVPPPSTALMREILQSRINVGDDPVKFKPTPIESARSYAAFCEANRQMFVKMGKDIRGDQPALVAQNGRIVEKWEGHLAVAIERVVASQDEWELAHTR